MTTSVSKLTEKQGIVTILGSDIDRTGAASASLPRTLSADMSSKKWLAQNGFSSMKKIASSKALSLSNTTPDSSSSSEGEEEDFREGRKEIEAAGRGQFDIWSSIISQKANDDTSKSLPPPYVHPLVKSSQSSLSKKSLEICTESLGSETGSDGFSSYPSSETADEEDQVKEEEQEQQQSEKESVHSYDTEEDFSVAKYNYAAASKNVTPRPFPPPLASLSRHDGASLRMRSIRDNGRLVLEAVSVPSQKNFHAERQDGRLVLTFVDDRNGEELKVDDGDELVVENDYNEQEIDDMDEMEEEFGEFENDQEEKENDDDEDDRAEEELEVEEVETKDIEIVIEDVESLSNACTRKVHRLALMINKPYANRNPSWSHKFNEVVKFKKAEEEEEVDVVMATPVAQSLPPRPRTTRLIPSSTTVGSVAAGAAASLNVYEYYWRTKPTAKAKTQIVNQLMESSPLKNNNKKFIVSRNVQMPNEEQQLIVLRGKKGDYLVPMLKTCKEHWGSFLFGEPYCIATS